MKKKPEEDGALAPRPRPEPRVLQCPRCGATEPTRASPGDIIHTCEHCGTSWQPARHATVFVTEGDLDRARLIHESERIEAALSRYGFPSKAIPSESSFDRMLDALAAAERAGHELEEERDEARKVLDKLVGLVETLLSDAGYDYEDLRKPERELLARAKEIAAEMLEE